MNTTAPHIAFALVWLVTALLYAYLTWRAYQDRKVQFPAFGYRIPPEIKLEISGVRFQVWLNEFATQFDQHVERMNTSGNQAATVALRANAVSCALAVAALVAEVSSW